MGTHRTLPQSRLDQPARFYYILQIHRLAESHTRMCLREPDHALQLSGSSCNPLFLGTRVGADLAHLDVGLNERIRGSFSEERVDLCPRVGDVSGERIKGLEV